MLLRLIIFCAKLGVLLSLVGAVILAYIVFYYSRDLPNYSQLERYYPASVTRMYSADGKLMEEFAKERRVFVPINSIPKTLTNAFIAAEDKNFYTHEGIDFSSIVRAAITNISHIMNNRRFEGGSTITQQVVKNFLLSSERSFERKIKEAILSYMVSQTFTKDQILELYLNQIYLGKGAYGVAAASLYYFNKSIEQLTVNECAVLASLPKAPSKYNPAQNYERALQRKNYVIGRMYDDGYLTENQARQAIEEPITLYKYEKARTIDANYYAARVREEVINMFGEDYFYTAGLTILTCVNSEMQQAATNALRYGIQKYDKKKGYRGVLGNINTNDWQKELNSFTKPIGILNSQIAVVLTIQDNEAKIGLENGSLNKILLKDTHWAASNLTSMKKLFKVGDVVIVNKLGDHHALAQIPEVNGGIMVIEHGTGRVLAAEGGYDFYSSKFDRTTQANRQPGSLIKPFVYMAALENGAKPNDIFDDAPIEIQQSPYMPNWQPKNWDNKFLGPITLRAGLEKSRNTVTVRVGQFAGLSNISKIIQRFGINEQPPMVHSVVLGSVETTLSKMTTAYSMIANGGRYVEPQFIEFIKDRKGNVIYKRDYTECPQCSTLEQDSEGNFVSPQITPPTRQRITDAATSYQMISLLMGGVSRGTGAATKNLKQIMAGKTGTTNKAKDAWFIGFTPHITVGTYIGFDNPRSLGNKAYGATIALPIFVHFMQNGYKDAQSVDFIVPDSIELVNIDYDSGWPSNSKGTIIEAFKRNPDNPSNQLNNQPIGYSIDPILELLSDLDDSDEIY
ncbi:MAG: penicillin-binding protein 1A [Rickettsiaceae bacterium]